MIQTLSMGCFSFMGRYEIHRHDQLNRIGIKNAKEAYSLYTQENFTQTYSEVLSNDIRKQSVQVASFCVLAHLRKQNLLDACVCFKLTENTWWYFEVHQGWVLGSSEQIMNHNTEKMQEILRSKQSYRLTPSDKASVYFLCSNEALFMPHLQLSLDEVLSTNSTFTLLYRGSYFYWPKRLQKMWSAFKQEMRKTSGKPKTSDKTYLWMSSAFVIVLSFIMWTILSEQNIQAPPLKQVLSNNHASDALKDHVLSVSAASEPAKTALLGQKKPQHIDLLNWYQSCWQTYRLANSWSHTQTKTDCQSSGEFSKNTQDFAKVRLEPLDQAQIPMPLEDLKELLQTSWQAEGFQFKLNVVEPDSALFEAAKNSEHTLLNNIKAGHTQGENTALVRVQRVRLELNHPYLPSTEFWHYLKQLKALKVASLNLKNIQTIDFKGELDVQVSY